jgi:amidase
MVLIFDNNPAPVCPFAAVEHTKFRHVAYTGVYNILDYSCLSFPCNVTVDQAVDVSQTAETPLSETDSLVQQECKFARFYDGMESLETNTIPWLLDNAAAIHDMPVSLQLVGRRLEEEKVLMMGEVILWAL